MDFSFTKDQKMIRKSAREFFEKECPKDKVRELKDNKKGYDPKMWKKMVKLGFMGLFLPEAYGGTEGEFTDLMIFMEEIGRNIVPSPFFATVVLSSMPILKFGNNQQKTEILPKIAEKGEIWTLAQSEEVIDTTASSIKLTAALKESEYILNGTKFFVPYANVANKMLVVARTENGGDPKEGTTVFIVDAKSPGITIEHIPTTAHDMQCEVRFKNVKVSKENILGELNKGWLVVDYIGQMAAVLKAAEMSGGARAVLDLTVKYTKERHQFDKPIASFQAIQHKLVELLTDVDGLKYLIYEAVWQINQGSPSRTLNSMSKIKANSVYHNVCYYGIYLQGAIGWTEEMDVGLYHIRTRSLIYDGGGSDDHYHYLSEDLEKYKPAFQEMYS